MCSHAFSSHSNKQYIQEQLVPPELPEDEKVGAERELAKIPFLVNPV